MNSKIYFDNPIYATIETNYGIIILYKFIQKSKFQVASIIDKSYVAYKLLQDLPYEEFNVENHEYLEDVVRLKFPEIYL